MQIYLPKRLFFCLLAVLSLGLAAVAGGLSGALSGASALPGEWISQVNEATKQDPYTNNKRTIEETADGLYEAFLEKQKDLKDYIDLMGE